MEGVGGDSRGDPAGIHDFFLVCRLCGLGKSYVRYGYQIMWYKAVNVVLMSTLLM